MNITGESGKARSRSPWFIREYGHRGITFMSGGDGKGPGNTGLGHSGGKPSGNTTGNSSSSSGHGGSASGGNWHYSPGHGPVTSIGPGGEIHINITGGMNRGDPPLKGKAVAAELGQAV
ncbi:hypothetical protein F9C28_17460 [Shimwellia pseudoproteus]|nr:hypothetical protein [Shimwellia pseudoproteus]